MTHITVADQDKPLRRDAVRNRERILDAARDLFARRGLGVTLNDIAHHAGVGVGTVYRRFPDKTALIEGLFEQRMEALVALAHDAASDPDAWHGLRTFMERALELQAADRGFKDLVNSTPEGLERVTRIRERLLPLGVELVRRAQGAGQLRSDVAATDIPLIQLMVGSIIDAAHDVEPELWRRYLAMVLRGIGADGAEPALEPAAPHPDDIDRVMANVRPARR